MANSSIITTLKDKVLSEMINDELLIAAINSPMVKDMDDAANLINTHLFRYNQNPETLSKQITYITVQVHIPESFTQRHGTDKSFVLPRLEFWIISHEKCMIVDNIPKITADRNDYISQILDEKFNGRIRIGLEDDPNPLFLLGKTQLVLNEEGALQKDYLYRHMIFETKDVNDSFCYAED